MVFQMNRHKKRAGFLFLVTLSLIFLSRPAEAGREWVTEDSIRWNVLKTCTDGAEMMFVDDGTGSAGQLSTFTRGVSLQRFIGDPSSLLDADGNLLNSEVEDAFYFPAIGVEQKLTAQKGAPIFVDFGSGEQGPFDLYVSGTVYFNQEMRVGSWVLYDKNLLDQVQDCTVGRFSSEETTALNWLAPAYAHLPLGEVVYTLDEVPTAGSLRLGGTTLVQGGRFTAEQLVAQGLTFAGAGGDQTLKISASGVYRVSADKEGKLLNGASGQPTISADGAAIAYVTGGVFDSAIDQNGEIDVVFQPLGVAPARILSMAHNSTVTANGRSINPALSPDGKRLAYSSEATNLVSPDACGGQPDGNHSADIFLVEVEKDTTTRVSDLVSGGGCVINNGDSAGPSLAQDGMVVFQTGGVLSPSLAGTDSNLDRDIIGWRNGRMTLFSAFTSGPSQMVQTGNGGSALPSISADGTMVAFETIASDLFANDNNGLIDIVLRQADGSFKNVSVTSDGVQADGHSFFASLSSSGDHIAFLSQATNLSSLDEGGFNQVFVRDEAAGCTLPISANLSTDGLTVLGMGNGYSNPPSISADGRFVAFRSDATNLLPTDMGGVAQIYLFDRDADGDGDFYRDRTACLPGQARMVLISAAVDGTPGDGESFQPKISGNGEFVIFASAATNLLPAEAGQHTNDGSDVYVRYLGFDVTVRFLEPDVPAPESISVYLPFVVRP